MSFKTRSAALAVALAALAIVACSLIYDIPDECVRDSDCIGIHGTETVCRSGLCVRSTEPPDGDADSDTDVDGDADVDGDPDGDADQDGDADADHDVETDADPEGDGDADALTPEDLLTAECPRIIGVDLEHALDDDVILLGALTPMTGDLAILGPYLEKAMELAIDEINSVGGVYGDEFAVIACDSSTDTAIAQTAAEHLVDVAGVQAIIGPFSSGIVIDVFNAVARDAGVILVSAGANAPVMSTISAEGLIWSTSLPAARMAQAIAHHLIHEDFTRVGVVNRDDTWGNDMRDAMEDVYCAERDCSAVAYLPRVYDVEDFVTSQSVALAELVPFAPDVVVLISYIEDGIAFLTAAGYTPLTRMITPDGLRDEVTVDLIPHQEVLCRLLGTSAAMPDARVFNAFSIRYQARWGIGLVPYTANQYDAVYMLAYAVSAAMAEDGEVTGATIAAAMDRLSSGTEIETGSGDWNTGINALRSATGATIDYVGASGDVDFIAGTGSVVTDVEAWHFNLELGGPESLGTVYSIGGEYTPPDYGLATADPVCDGVIGD
jgi:branched-chain amino acid transport system substrate-binding protein